MSLFRRIIRGTLYEQTKDSESRAASKKLTIHLQVQQLIAIPAARTLFFKCLTECLIKYQDLYR